MKKHNLLYLLLIPAVVMIITLDSCSKLEDNLVTAPTAGIHPDGWTNPVNANFHGKYFFSNKWDFKFCTQCHGADYNGGNTGKSCNDPACHGSSTPEDCRLCHGDRSTTIFPPVALNGSSSITYIGVGTHNTHLNRDSSLRNSARLRCVSCHKSISGFFDPNHIGSNPDNIAEVVFDSLSITTTNGITPNPVWSRTNPQSCAVTYCHGNFKNGNYRLNPTTMQNPVWTDPNSVYCGTCHGNPSTGNPLPGGTHVQGFTINNCYFCHGAVISSTGNIINKSKHINGVINMNQ